jgi:hypothetical protein
LLAFIAANRAGRRRRVARAYDQADRDARDHALSLGASRQKSEAMIFFRGPPVHPGGLSVR